MNSFPRGTLFISPYHNRRSGGRICFINCSSSLQRNFITCLLANLLLSEAILSGCLNNADCGLEHFISFLSAAALCNSSELEEGPPTTTLPPGEPFLQTCLVLYWGNLSPSLRAQGELGRTLGPRCPLWEIGCASWKSFISKCCLLHSPCSHILQIAVYTNKEYFSCFPLKSLKRFLPKPQTS